MKTSVMISKELLNQVGLPEVMQSCHCRTPQGKRLKNAARFFTNSSRDEFVAEITAIARLVEMVKVRPKPSYPGFANFGALSHVSKKAGCLMIPSSLSLKVR